MATEIERITRLLEKTFDKAPWYGPSMTDVLTDLEEKISDKRIGEAHTIIELLRHMISWRTFAAKRLQGDNAFEVTDETNFPKTGSWKETIRQLQTSQQSLLEAVRSFPEGRLGELVPSKSHQYTYYTLLHGIIQHDIYHLGQIAILKRALAST